MGCILLVCIGLHWCDKALQDRQLSVIIVLPGSTCRFITSHKVCSDLFGTGSKKTALLLRWRPPRISSISAIVPGPPIGIDECDKHH